MVLVGIRARPRRGACGLFLVVPLIAMAVTPFLSACGGSKGPVVVKGRVLPAAEADLKLFAVFPGEPGLGEYVGRPGTHRILLATTSTGGSGEFDFRSKQTPAMQEGVADGEVWFAVSAEQVRPSSVSLGGEVYCDDWEGILHLAEVDGHETWVAQGGQPVRLTMTLAYCESGGLP
jgi:hypothetical protein